MTSEKLFVLRSNDPNHALEDITLDFGEVFLGRGPLFKITDTGISRKHVRVNIRKDNIDDASFLLTCIHRSGVFIRKSGTDNWKELQEGKTEYMSNGDEFKLLHDKFNFLVLREADTNNEDTNEERIISDKTVITPEKEKENSNEEDNLIITPKPTGLKCEKKRKLPDWMMASTSGESKKVRQESVEKSKRSPIQDTYAENVQYINSALKEEKQTVQTSIVTDTDEKDEANFENQKLLEKNSESLFLLANVQDNSESLLNPDGILEAALKQSIPKDATNHVLSDDDDDDKENKVNDHSKPKAARKACPYGAKCYRKNPVHRVEESHPGDNDFKDPDAEEEDDDDGDKPECEYGTDCYRKNPQHRKQFKHSKKRKRKAVVNTEKKMKKKEDDYDSDDSFINDEDDWEPVDDSDEDADFEAPADMSSELE